MANNKKDKPNNRGIKKVNDSLDILDSKMEDIYKSTYNSRRDNKENLDRITDDIYATVRNIVSNNSNLQNVPNVTRLYTRLNNKNNVGNSGGEAINSITEVLTNNSLINTISMAPETNRYLKMMDVQYDMICKYMPKLEKALEIKKDNVLSADNFSKEFINITSDQLSSDDKKIFDERAEQLKKIYKIDNLFEKIYSETSKYGEYFLYCVPYKKAFEELLKSKGGNLGNNSIKFESTCLLENGNVSKEYRHGISQELLSKFSETKSNINIQFDKSNLLSETVWKYDRAEKLKSRLKKKKSMREAFYESVDNKKVKLDKKIFDDSLDYGKEFDNIANDGLVPTTKVKDDDINVNEIPGCICKKLKHENVIPLYIEDICIGYYYFEFLNDEYNDPTRNNIINSSTFPTASHVEENEEMRENPLLRTIASRISDIVDAQFINNNQDLKEEIYIMLKYNERFNISNTNNVRVTFLPVEDVYHFYFDLNEETHHGRSDLEKSLIPAMFWCLLDLSTTIGIVTRAQDKRIYYVKQNVDTNVARTLMNVINQVKKGNFGVRQMESMGNILNVVGKYNDHVIPMGPNGEAPIQFEVMSGQNIETPEVLMNKFEDSAIDLTGVPLEFVNAVMQVDFATKYTMQHSLFLRKVFKRQFICELGFTEIFTMIYNYEYQENENTIKVMLPAPAVLAMTNGAQLIQGTKEYIQNIADTEYPEDSPEKNEFIKLLVRHYLPTHINVPLIDRTKEMAKININTQHQKAEGEEM